MEEEFHLVDLTTRRLTARAPELLEHLSDDFTAELQRCVAEMTSKVAESLEGLRDHLLHQRGVLIETAADLGIEVVAVGAVPLTVPAENAGDANRPSQAGHTMTMAWDLEARVPLLPHNFVELAARCPRN